MAVLLVVLFGLAPAVEPQAARAAVYSGYITRTGSQLYAGSAKFRFVGLNMYNVNSTGIGTRRSGPGTCWYPTLSGDISTVAKLSGATVLRGWFFQSLLLRFDPTTLNRNGSWDWSVFDRTISEARTAGVKLIATLADEWGACEPGGTKGLDWYQTGYSTSLATDGLYGGRSTPMPATYKDYVKAIVNRYKLEPTILAWDLVNEAEDPTIVNGVNTGCASNAGQVMRSFNADMATTIRSIDRKHLVVASSAGGGQCGSGYVPGESNTYRQFVGSGQFDWCEAHDY